MTLKEALCEIQALCVEVSDKKKLMTIDENKEAIISVNNNSELKELFFLEIMSPVHIFSLQFIEPIAFVNWL